MEKVSTVAQAFVQFHKVNKPNTQRVIPKIKASSGDTSFAGIGLVEVLVIRESSLRSIHWLSAAAPPADKAVPIVRAKKSTKSDFKGSCTKKPKEAVKTERKLSLGFVNS